MPNSENLQIAVTVSYLKKHENKRKKSTGYLVDIHLLLDSTVHQHLGLGLLADSLLAVDSVGNLALLGNHGLALLALAEFLADEVLALVDDLAVGLALALAGQLAGQTALGEDTLAAGSDLLDSLHGGESGGHEVAVVLDGDVSLLGELGQDER